MWNLEKHSYLVSSKIYELQFSLFLGNHLRNNPIDPNITDKYEGYSSVQCTFIFEENDNIDTVLNNIKSHLDKNPFTKYVLMKRKNEDLYRIFYVKTFGIVHTGEIGGLVSNVTTLSHEGRCNIAQMVITGNGVRVVDNATIFGHLEIRGKASITGDSTLYMSGLIDGVLISNDRSFYHGNIFIKDKGLLSLYGETKVYGDLVINKGLECDDTVVFGSYHHNTLIDGHFIFIDKKKPVDLEGYYYKTNFDFNLFKRLLNTIYFKIKGLKKYVWKN